MLLGGDVVDRAMLLEFLMERVMPTLQAGNDDAQRAANELQSDPMGLSVDGMVQGKANAVGSTVHTQIVASHSNPVVVSATEYVTQDGTFSPLGTVLIFEAYDGMRRRAAANAGRSVKVEHSKQEGVLVTVRGLGAVDDTNIDAYPAALQRLYHGMLHTTRLYHHMLHTLCDL